MSLFGSLFTGVSALSAQSQALSMISNNIANVSTIGYKGDNASFSSMVTVAQRGVTYNPGGVRVQALQTVSQQGLIQGTSSSTDVAISGDGFFVVKDTTDTASLTDPAYTRAGTFTEDSEGFLQNASGYYLYGWLLDGDGNIPAANADISSTQPVNVSFLNGVASGTTKIQVGMNLNANQALGASSDTFVNTADAAELTTALNASAGYSYNFDVTVTDASGTATTTNITVADGDTLATVAGYIDAIPGVTATIVNNQLVVNAETVTGKVTMTDGASGNVVTQLFGNGSLTQLGYDFTRDITIYDSLGSERSLSIYYKKTAVNNWTVEVRVPQSDVNLVLPVNRTTGLVDTVTGDDGYVANGTITFNTDGSINSVSGQIANPFSIQWDPAYIGAGAQSISLDLGIDSAGQGTDGAVTQFGADYDVSFLNQNGSELGRRTGISIDEDGYIIASFSNGQFRKLYKIPIATFANPNGLQARSGNVYTQTTDSGQYNLREAGAGGAGSVQGGSLEQSNIDLSDEFTKMIVTQRAYSAGTKVIKTADDMLDELMRLR